jgi:hypothetical protein
MKWRGGGTVWKLPLLVKLCLHYAPWQFNVVVVEAEKPKFYKIQRPFREVDQARGRMRCVSQLCTKHHLYRSAL